MNSPGPYFQPPGQSGPPGPNRAPGPYFRTTPGVPFAALVSGIGGLAGGMFGVVGAWGAVAVLDDLDRIYGADDETARHLRELDYRLQLAQGSIFLVLLGIGGVLLLLRQSAGRAMVITGYGLAVCFFVSEAYTGDSGSEGIGYLVWAGLALGLLVTAALPATARWTASAPRTPGPPHPR